MTTHARERVGHLLRKWEFRVSQTDTQEKSESLWKTLGRYWLRFARMLGKANTFLLLTIVYFVLIGPGAIILKVLHKDLLDRRSEERASYWYDKAPVDQDVDRSKHQF